MSHTTKTNGIVTYDNRTYLELKSRLMGSVMIMFIYDNRTYVELKLLFNADGAKYFDK